MLSLHFVYVCLALFISASTFQKSLPLLEKDRVSYYIKPYMPVNHLGNGTILAIAQKGERRFIDTQLMQGTLPPGIMLFGDGTIAVNDEDKIQAGKYTLKIRITDDQQEINTVKIKLVINKPDEKSQQDRIPSVRVYKAKDLKAYMQGDILAKTVDPDGEIIKAELVKGKLPDGIFLTHDGQIKVNDPTKLQKGNYTFCLYVEDKFRGNDFIILSLDLGAEISHHTGK